MSLGPAALGASQPAAGPSAASTATSPTPAENGAFSFFNHFLMPVLLLTITPVACHVLAFITGGISI